ncbi:TPA: histidine phosphatase family protein [Serratia marcescens]|uniref:Histidine phosphatase family protein n=2 Tax=Serratia TaxID=613 RepID=A0A9X8VMA4_SERMA|nr:MULTISPECIES: histidine phosphatase family protein [Serratia]MBS3894922.1 histidine phosphatase family protein [Serratia marcescens]TXE26722.1 histidine phosphatase family protein [Serratia ureilytica]HBC7421398.1 histidine phosphatase family protein [Serratia marcescens]
MSSSIKLSIVLMLISTFSSSIYAKQTIVFVRHGEKPVNNSGQLTCKGLNRALALPDILISRYGKPDNIFASAPKEDKPGSSLRPLSTIIPTAIRLSKPINLNYHATDISGITRALLHEDNKNSLSVVSWEHKNLVTAAKAIVEKEGGDPSIIPEWPGDDFDSIYVLTLNRDVTPAKVTFIHEKEGLNAISENCPSPK